MTRGFVSIKFFYMLTPPRKLCMHLVWFMTWRPCVANNTIIKMKSCLHFQQTHDYTFAKTQFQKWRHVYAQTRACFLACSKRLWTQPWTQQTKVSFCAAVHCGLDNAVCVGCSHVIFFILHLGLVDPLLKHSPHTEVRQKDGHPLNHPIQVLYYIGVDRIQSNLHCGIYAIALSPWSVWVFPSIPGNKTRKQEDYLFFPLTLI